MTGQRLVVVAGSINMDIVASVARHPQPGETVVAARHRHMPGGKGANQAVAAARAGATVRLFGAVGDDLLGDDLLGFLERSGVGVAGVRRTTSVASGAALCVVDADGRNTIVVVPGANASIDEAAVVLRDAAEGAVFVAQYEIPVESTVAFLAHGRKVGATCILNPAPANPTPADVLAMVDVLVLNETELTSLTGATVTAASSTDEIVDALRALRAQGLEGTAVVTLGGRGALALIDDELRPFTPYRVRPIDTTGAGDCFVGSLAAELAAGKPLRAALAYANSAAALCVTRPGAGLSMPHRSEVESFMNTTPTAAQSGTPHLASPDSRTGGPPSAQSTGGAAR